MLLGLDLGTGSLKALVMNTEGQVIAESSSAYPVASPRPGWAETQPAAWWEAACRATQALSKAVRQQVKAIGFSGQMHGVILCKKDGVPLRPAILWADTRSSAQLNHYRKLSGEQLERLANPLTVGMAGPSLLWLKENEAAVYEATCWALQPKDWLRLKLTGIVSSEPSDASGTLLYDLREDSWSDDIVAALGLRRDMLAPLKASSQTAGKLTKEAAVALGLTPGLPVATGGADAACSAFGSGLINPGQVQVNIGTAMQIFAVRAGATVDPSLRTHFYRTVLNNYYAMAAMQNAGIALEWVRDMLGLSWDSMYSEAFSVEAGSEGLTFLPYLTGERTPHLDPDARGAWHGLTLRHGRGHLARAALEGVAFALKDGLNALADVGINPNELRLAGGGALRPEWRQLLADVLDKPLYAVAVPAASARGAALLAGLAIDAFSRDDLATRSPAAELCANPTGQPYQLAYERFGLRYQQLRQQKSG